MNKILSGKQYSGESCYKSINKVECKKLEAFLCDGTTDGDFDA